MEPAPVSTYCATIAWIIFSCIVETAYGATSSGGSNYVGCYKDEGDPKAFRGLAENFNDLTPQKCTQLCYSKGFLYSATQGRTFCFCNDKHPNPNSKVSEDRCSRPCAGNSAEKCGGEFSISVSKTGIPDHPEVHNYLGCFDDHSRLLNDFAVVFDKTNSPRRCMNYCLQLGYQYSGVQYGRGCHCGSIEPDHQLSRSGEDCNWPCTGDPDESCGGNWRMAIYSTKATGSQTSTEVGKYLGCYKELANPVKSSYVENDNDLTLQKCTASCYSKGFLYSWTQSSTFCFCGDKHPNPNSKVSEDQCSKPCGGKAAERCGGEAAISVRETGIPDFPDVGKYVGCFDDHTRLLKDVALDLDFTNSPKRCMNLCMQKGYQYSGVQYGKGCHCGNKEPSAEHSEIGDDCNWPCSGDPFESCGGNWRMAIYSTNVNAASAALPLGTTSGRDPCVQSDTVANGNTVCKGDVVFEDSFSGRAFGNKWKHVIMIPGAPDYEFNVFHSDNKNCFKRSDKLVIRPTVYDDEHVLSGTLRLQGCTAPPDSRHCGYKAFSTQILPPVASARLNTRDSFSFRYGVVEIRAKLPKGDWLVPELWLEPKNHHYGPDYASGRVRIAMSRGNEDFYCNGEDSGLRHLESGVTVGPKNNVRKKTIRTKLPENWHSQYHNYTLIWRPGSISFKIDNEDAREVVPTGSRLCEVHDFTHDECLTWSSGSKLAPFDKDFYITLGLSTGNAWDFPDECLNRGKLKPWKNNELRAMLKFWQDKDSWYSTWSDEASALYIDHIRVTAL